MPGEVKPVVKEDLTTLKPCPFCGSEAEFERMGTGRCSTIVACTGCGCRLESGETFNHHDSWNRRTHAPMTSVIEWTRYDGTPETLPKKASRVLLSTDSKHFYIDEAFFMIFSNGYVCWQVDFRDAEVQIGDIWAYITEPPEGIR